MSICVIIHNIKSRNCVRIYCGFFYSVFLSRVFFARAFYFETGDNMQLFLIKNPDDTQIVSYKLARIVYAETMGISLQSVESMAAMIHNIHVKYEKSFEDIAMDKNIFDVLDENSSRHQYLNIDANDRKFQMCLRVVKTMMRGNLPDCVFGATKFHHSNIIPQWAMSRGYITECEDILYYL